MTKTLEWKNKKHNQLIISNRSGLTNIDSQKIC